MKKARNTAACEIRSARRSAQSNLGFIQGVTKNQSIIYKTKEEGRKEVGRTLGSMKRWLGDIQENHAKGIL